jgi:CheY-like chemotaxis protein
VVLVVDDEPDIRLIARVVLTSAGHEVKEAGSGEEAVAQVDAGRPDLMLLDVRMPGMDGWAVLDHVRDKHEGLPVVVFTADVRARAEARREWRPSEHLLVKPFGPDELLAAVDAAIT